MFLILDVVMENHRHIICVRRVEDCISKDASEKVKNNVSIGLSSWEHPSLPRRKKQWQPYQVLLNSLNLLFFLNKPFLWHSLNRHGKNVRVVSVHKD